MALTAARTAIVAGGAIAGLAATSYALDISQPWLWASDVAVTLAFSIAAAITLRAAPAAALLAGLVAATWAFANFVPFAIYWHRAVLIHLLVLLIATSVRWWPRDFWARLVIVLGYAVSATPIVWGTDAAAVASAAGLAGAAVVLSPRGVRTTRPVRIVLLLFATIIGLGAIVHTLDPTPAVLTARAIVYPLILVVAAATVAAVLRPQELARATDAVVELDEVRGDAVAERLGAAIGDRSLRIGWWDDRRAEYIAADGSVVVGMGSQRSTVVERSSGKPLALVVADSGRVADPVLAAAVVRAAELRTSNARLLAEASLVAQEVAESRARIVLAGEADRRELARRLETEVGEPLRLLADGLRRQANATSTHARFDLPQDLIERACRELVDLSSGLNPPALSGGISAALTGLQVRTPVPLELRVNVRTALTDEVAAVAYYVCAEAVANAVRHARAERLTVEVSETDGELVVAVRDDGRGGANEAAGSGIGGLRERTRAIGGRLELESTVGQGTVIRARVPLGVGSP